MSQTLPVDSIRIQNDGNQIIPPYSIVVVTSVEIGSYGPGQEQMCIHHVEQYTGQAGNIYVTGPIPLAVTDDDIDGARAISKAYADPLLYVSIDQSVPTPKVGEQWGPVPNQWYISRGGMGFFAQGFDSTNGDPTKAIFKRDRGWAWAKLAGSLSAPSSASSPTTCNVNIWHYEPTDDSNSSSSVAWPPPLVEASNSNLLNITVINYDPSLSGQSGYLCKIEEFMGIRTFYWVGCKADSSSSSGS